MIKVLGRTPDSCIEAGEHSYCHWYYETKADGRDLLGATFTKNEKVENISY